jgi:amino acid adenylation domain-containing protein
MSALSIQDEDLLAYLLEEEGIEVCQSIPRRNSDAASPLSFSQQRLWFLQELEPKSAAYNLPRALFLRGDLNVVALEQSFCEIVRRHEVLRTSFSTIDGEAVQIVNPAQPLRIAVEDLGEWPVAERDERVRQLVLEEARVPFDLTSAPLLRLQLLRLASDEHVLLLTMHHIVSDEWSTGIFISEIRALYQAFVRGGSSPLPELPIQYADYAEWQASWLKSEQAAEQLAYWKKQLAGELPLLRLGTSDHKRPPVQTFNGASRSLLLGAHLYEDVKRLSREENASLFMTLFAVFTALVHRYSGQEDILVGSPIAGRERPEVEGLIGFFVNTLVLRVDFSGNQSFRSLLAQVREVALDAYAHQSLPFELLVRELQPERSLSHSPLFQITFATREAQRATLEPVAVNLEVQPLYFDVESAKFDIFLSVDDTGRDLNANLIYNSDLFDGAAIERLLRHFQTLLESAVSDPDQPVSSLSLVTQQEQQQLLVEWNNTRAERATQPESVTSWFEQQVERTPDAIALSAGAVTLSYRELNARANQLARHLQQIGVERETLVGVYLDRSAEMIVALLGTWKAGATYVPLNSEYPRQRLAMMIDDSAMPFVITQQALLDGLPETAARVVCVDRDTEDIKVFATGNSLTEVGSGDVAYIIYTSGSAGKPKGVRVTHGNLVHTLLASVETFDFAATDTMPCLAAMSFDISLFEVLNPLLTGGRLLFVTREEVLDLDVLLAHLKQSTIFHAVPSLLRQIVGQIKQAGESSERFAQVRLIFTGGEAVPPDLLSETQQIFANASRKVLYGPTEATIICASFAVDAAEEVVGHMVGRPLPNVRLRVYDGHRNLVPVGVAGELYLGGGGIAAGYLQQQELTQERFVWIDEERYYRTGDRVRYLADGNLEFLGRIDEQVKIRGFRIELGEIEFALTQHDSVTEAIVIAREDEHNDKRLVAYVVCDREARPSTSELRSHLHERLPEYMVPSFFVMLDSIPLTPNGKVDRKALPEPELSRPDLDGVFVAPRSLVEEMVAQIWSDVLGIDQVGVNDNFFALGGHSLVATTTVTRLREAFNVDLPLRAIFEGPTVSHLSELIEAAQRAGRNLSLPPLVRVSRAEPLPLSFAQEGLWFNDQMVPGGNSAYNVQVAVRLQGRLDSSALEQALNKIVQRHESLRTNFTTIEGRPVQISVPESTISVTIQDVSDLPEDQREAEVLRLATGVTQQAFDLSSDGLLRADLFRLHYDLHVLVLVIHHIVCDAWSMGVLIQEVAALYEACREGREPVLAELPVQYADYAKWQRDWLQGEQLEQQLAYWRKTLANLPELRLKTDRPRSAVRSFRGAHYPFTLPSELSASLRELARREKVTLYMLMLAAFKALLHYYSQSEEIVVGTDIANRSRVETEGLIGLFATQLVLRTSVAGDPVFTEIMSRVREVSLEAFIHQDSPFEEVVKALSPEREMNRNPLFQVVFGFSNTPPPVVTLPELTLSGVEIEKGTALTDLNLYLTDTPQGMRGMLRYSTDLFESATIERLREHYEKVLAHIVAQPDARLSDLVQVLAESDRDKDKLVAAGLKQTTRQKFQNIKRRSA